MPQAQVAESRGESLIVQDRNLAQSLVVDPARLVTENGRVFHWSKGVVKRSLQNMGTNVVYVLIAKLNPNVPEGDPLAASAENCHFALAACTAQDDGTGSLLDLSDYEGDIYIAGAGAAPRVLTFQARGPEMGGAYNA